MILSIELTLNQFRSDWAGFMAHARGWWPSFAAMWRGWSHGQHIAAFLLAALLLIFARSLFKLYRA